ncbi:MAG: amidohydrolase family protein [Lachnospiraceae bacterium]|nr:amidohydrolase family protein [Lachnospiraceae bacterium]
MDKTSFVIKGNLVYADAERKLHCEENSYLICEQGEIIGTFARLPEQFEKLPFYDHQNALVIPGMTDLHVHAPQYTYRGMGMDCELLTWLEKYAFPEESRYQDTAYADRAYSIFTEDLQKSVTTRACMFATIHNQATELLMDKMEKSGLVSFVGRVNMDRNGGVNLCEKSAAVSASETEEWIQETLHKYECTKPILTPRFTPSCSDELMGYLGKLAAKYQLRVQSHLSENLSEIAWVKELVPTASCYGDAYSMFDMLGDEKYPAIMAHCVHSTEPELELLKQHHTYIAHSPESNMNVSSGIAPIRKYLEYGLHTGLASDIAGGSSISIMKAATQAIQVSKLYWRLVDQDAAPLTFADAFYLATLGGGSYFGKVGSFQSGFEADILVLDDSQIRGAREFSLAERMERAFYEEKDLCLKAKYVQGRRIVL